MSERIPFSRWLGEYNISRDGTVVDFGCGTGLARIIFEDMHYIGIDQNEAMLDGICQRWEGRDPKVNAYEAPLSQILVHHPELEGVADLGCFITVLQHNHWETAAEILDQAYRILKPNTHLMLFEGTYIEKHYPEEVRRKYDLPELDPERLECVDGGAIFTPKGWEHFLGQHGFELLEYDGDCSYILRRI
jgi:SAM-dependent methyltransferase